MSYTPQLRNQNVVRFDFLNGCLPGRVAPTDLDQVLERNGHLLVIECKRPNQSIPMGQAITFNTLLKGPRSVHLLIVTGQPPNEIEAYRWWGNTTTHTGNVDDVRRLARRWWDWAER